MSNKSLFYLLGFLLIFCVHLIFPSTALASYPCDSQARIAYCSANPNDPDCGSSDTLTYIGSNNQLVTLTLVASWEKRVTNSCNDSALWSHTVNFKSGSTQGRCGVIGSFKFLESSPFSSWSPEKQEQARDLIDCDNDGFTGAEEKAAGTDPYNPEDYPGKNPPPDDNDDCVDLNSNGICDDREPPCPDSDGDGICDKDDPCPFDPTNSCKDNEDCDEDGIPDSEDSEVVCEKREPSACEAIYNDQKLQEKGFTLAETANKLSTILPQTPDKYRLPTIINNLAGEGTLGANLALELYSAGWQYLLIIVFVKFYKLIPGKST